jgi:hypothetical protein
MEVKHVNKIVVKDDGVNESFVSHIVAEPCHAMNTSFESALNIFSD